MTARRKQAAAFCFAFALAHTWFFLCCSQGTLWLFWDWAPHEPTLVAEPEGSLGEHFSSRLPTAFLL